MSFETAGDSSYIFKAGEKLKIYTNTTTNAIQLNGNPAGYSTPTGSFVLENCKDIKVTLIDIPSALKISDVKIRT